MWLAWTAPRRRPPQRAGRRGRGGCGAPACISSSSTTTTGPGTRRMRARRVFPRPRPGEDNAAGRARLAAAEQQASRTLPPDRLSSEQVEGSPARVLIDQSAGAELLVLGTAELASQSGSEGPPAVGPVARACLHAAACPVVIVAPCDAPCTPVCRRYPARGWSGRPVAEVLTCENRGVRGSSPR